MISHDLSFNNDMFHLTIIWIPLSLIKRSSEAIPSDFRAVTQEVNIASILWTEHQGNSEVGKGNKREQMEYTPMRELHVTSGWIDVVPVTDTTVHRVYTSTSHLHTNTKAKNTNKLHPVFSTVCIERTNVYVSMYVYNIHTNEKRKANI